jgi:hypothetical protein
VKGFRVYGTMHCPAKSVLMTWQGNVGKMKNGKWDHSTPAVAAPQERFGQPLNPKKRACWRNYF